MRFIIEILSLFLFLFYTVFIYSNSTSVFNDCDIPVSANSSLSGLTSIFPPDPKCFPRLCKIEVLSTFIYRYRNNYQINYLTEMTCSKVFQILLCISGIIVLSWSLFLHLSTQVQHINFNTNLDLYSRKTTFVVQTKVLSMIV